MSSGEMYRTPFPMLALLGILAALLFVLAGASLFVGRVAGIMASGVGAFGLMLLASAARSKRPSSFWLAVLAGFLIALAPTVLYVREMSLRPGQYWNQWALGSLPFAAMGGRAFGATRWFARVADRMLGCSPVSPHWFRHPED